MIKTPFSLPSSDDTGDRLGTGQTIVDDDPCRVPQYIDTAGSDVAAAFPEAQCLPFAKFSPEHAVVGTVAGLRSFEYTAVGLVLSFLLIPVGALLLQGGSADSGNFPHFLHCGHPLTGLAAAYRSVFPNANFTPLVVILWPIEWMLYGYVLDRSIRHCHELDVLGRIVSAFCGAVLAVVGVGLVLVGALICFYYPPIGVPVIAYACFLAIGGLIVARVGFATRPNTPKTML